MSGRRRELSERVRRVIRYCTPKLRGALLSRSLPWYLAGLAMLLCAPSLWLGLQWDDYVHLGTLTRPELELHRSPLDLFGFVKGGAEHNRQSMARGFLPWWSHENVRLALFRPLTALTHWWDYGIWRRLPVLMHLHSLVWLGGVVAAATFFYRRTVPAGSIAGLAALLFAVDDAHGMPAVWLANRNALIGAFFGLLALIAHDRWRREGWRAGGALAPVAFLLGLLSNEGVVATGAYLLAYALFLDRDTWSRRLRALAPCALTGALWWLAYKQLGYGITGSGMYVDPGASPLRFLGAVAQRAPFLLLGQWLFPADLQLVLSQRAAHALWLGALGFLALVAAALAPLVRRDPLARFWTVGMLLSVLPACATAAADRLLFFVGIGATGLLAQFVAATWNNVDWLPPPAWWRLPARGLAALLVVVHLGIAPLALTRTAANVERSGGVFTRAAASLPADAANDGQTLMVVNTPSQFVLAYSWLIHDLDRNPGLPRALALGSGIHSTEIRRPDERTLVIRPAGGFLAPPGSPEPGHDAGQPILDVRYMYQLLDRLFRDDTPMRVGQRVELGDVTVEITAITADGRPAEAAFHFAAELESRTFRWLQWQDGEYAPFTPPAVGASVTLPPAKVPL